MIHQDPNQSIENAFLTAKRAWNEHIGREVKARQRWQAVAIGALVVSFVSVGGALSVASQSKIQPYIVQVDKLGQAVGGGYLGTAAPADPRVIRATLAACIADARQVTSDADAEKVALYRLHAFLAFGDPAITVIHDWIESEAGDPYKRAETETVTAEVQSVLPHSATTYQVDWLETTRERKTGAIKSQRPWRAMITIRIQPPEPGVKEADLNANPLGIFIETISWGAL